VGSEGSLLRELTFFEGEQHLPFSLAGEASAALLVHGFPGTPAEMRPLGEALHQQGWSVRGILLPGFGPQIDRLSQYRYRDWTAAVAHELGTLRDHSGPILLVGYSLGGALALQAATTAPVDGLVLIAPFWYLGGGLRARLLPVLKWVFPHFRPFHDADLSTPEVRSRIERLSPGCDLDDPEVRAAIRALTIPTSAIDELRRVGRAAYRSARSVHSPVLVVQGTQDEVARPEWTRQLTQRLSAPVEYHEVQADHELLAVDCPAWSDVSRLVLAFAARLVKPANGRPQLFRGDADDA
jgi:carboxylesterase